PARLDPRRDLFDLNRNLMLKVGDPSNAKRAPFATLIFPVPEKIASLRLAAVPREAFIDPTIKAEDSESKAAARESARKKLAVDGEKQYVATLQVFTYTIENLNQLALNEFEVKAVNGQPPTREPTGGHNWEPV